MRADTKAVVAEVMAWPMAVGVIVGVNALAFAAWWGVFWLAQESGLITSYKWQHVAFAMIAVTVVQNLTKRRQAGGK